MSKRYINVPKQPGIRKDTVTGKYQALKKIGGKQFAETFESIREAQKWRNVFNGDRASVEQAKTTSTLRHVWGRMNELHFPSLELSTRRIWERRWEPYQNLAIAEWKTLVRQ